MPIDELAISRAILDTHYRKLSRCLDSDVLIVGGGPAGLVAAAHLAVAGRRVVIIEREPLLEARPLVNGQPNVVLYGIPGHDYDIQSTPVLPARTCAGVSKEMVGLPSMTVNWTGSEMPPPTPGLRTVMANVPGTALSASGNTTVSQAGVPA